MGGGTLVFWRTSACATDCIFASSELVALAAEYRRRVLKLAMERCGSILLEMRRQASRDNRSLCFICSFCWVAFSIPVSEFYTTRMQANQRCCESALIVNCNPK